MTKILIIEDEEQIRTEVMDWLQFEGYEVIGAEDGQSGLDIAARETPDLILCDISMPEMDGHRVLLEVRSHPFLNHIPFIFLTAHANRESVRKGMELGADDYITKPFTLDEIINAINSRLEKQAAQNNLIQAHLDLLGSVLSDEREKRLLKSRLVAMFSHDFRNPLSAIKSSIELLLAYDERLTPEHRHGYLERMDYSVRQLLQMLDDVVLVAQIESGSFECAPQPLDVSAMTADIVDEFKLIHGDTHTLVFHSNIQHRLVIDPKIFRLIVTHLLSDSVKSSESRIDVNMMEDQTGIELEIRNQGAETPDDTGLPVVKQAVEMCGGSIYVEEVGTRFVVQFPREEVGHD